jgi:hypothetical protein
MTRSVIYHRQNHIEFYNNMFVFETLNVENTGNKNCNKKQRFETNKQTPFSVLNIYSQTVYTKTQNYSFIVHQVNTAKWSSRRLWCGVAYQSILLNLVNRVLEASALNRFLHLYVFHCYSSTDNVISSYANILKYFFERFFCRMNRHVWHKTEEWRIYEKREWKYVYNVTQILRKHLVAFSS